MDSAKITLSAKEAELVTNSDWILTKNHILQKVRWVLEDVQSRQLQFFQNHPQALPAEVITVVPKISRGENYKGLPYLVLDHPRYFGKDDHFAIRTMFWWGKFFSITLHVSGNYKLKYHERIIQLYSALKQRNYFIGIGDDQWEHHFDSGNYDSIADMHEDRFANILAEKEFIKLAKKFSLDQWDDMRDHLFASFCELISWLNN